MAQLVPVAEFDLVIFGGAGDLSLRKLLPALFHRDRDGQLTDNSRIIAVGRSPSTPEDYLQRVADGVRATMPGRQLPAEDWARFSNRLQYLSIDALDPTAWTPLAEALQGYQDRTRALYMATPPDLFGPVARGFRDNNLITENMRIVLEKPVGHDYASARAINDEVGACFAENQIFRIDHYLGKETVQNLLALRFGNSLFEPMWRREVVDHVQITVAEELGVGNRVAFYNDIGALRDMIQNHLMQLLCLVAMEPPSSLDDDAVRDEKIKVLRALKPIGTADVKSRTVRGQYTAGAIDGQTVPGYREELGGDSEIETFVALKVEIDNWRWSGVPFYLRTGKRLPAKHSEIVIQFKPVPHSIFDERHFETQPNAMSIQLQPDEGIRLRIMTKVPGPGGFLLKPASLNLSFAQTFEARYPDAYERLLMEVLRGNQALFMRRDEVETAWKWIDTILEGWAESRQKLESYMAGSWGPTAASMLLDRDERSWQVGS